MNNRKIILQILILFFVIKISSQNKQVLFGFDQIPQSLLINPGAEIDSKWHFGVPALSGIYAHAGFTGFSINDLFKNDGEDINDKLRFLLGKLNKNDFYTINQQLEVFNAGFRLPNKKDYLSFGFYEELDAISYHPKDLITFAIDGNADLTKVFNFSDVSFKAELLGVFHVGISRKINSKFTIGARAKLYSSVLNVHSISNRGFLKTSLGENNIYRHSLQDISLTLKTSGFVNGDEVVARDNIIGKFIASGNMGIGVDFGLTYRPKENLEITASFQDLGFVKHTKNIAIYEVKGNQTFDGLELVFPTNNVIDYWQAFEDDVEFNIPLDTINRKYLTARSVKVNSGLTYRFGKKNNNDCLRTVYKNPMRNEIGVQLFSIFRPKRIQNAATLFYYRRFNKYFRTKLTYTFDEYSAKNIGFGLSANIGMFNMYATFDNLLGLTDLASSQNQSFQFGMNIILDYNESKP